MENNNEQAAQNLSADSRNRIIVRTSVIGILANVLLAAAKAVIGFAANSIAVILDAVNNLSDALSSVVTILGAKLAGRAPDKDHPLGYGRVEYLSAMIVAGLVLYAGITSAVESVKKIIAPETPDYSTTALAVIAVAVLVKVVLGRYVKAQGEKANSGALIASGADASFDAVLSLSVLVSALIFVFTGVSLEAYVGVVISGFIIKAGVDMMKETLDDILGVRMDKALSRQIKSLLNEKNRTMAQKSSRFASPARRELFCCSVFIVFTPALLRRLPAPRGSRYAAGRLSRKRRILRIRRRAFSRASLRASFPAASPPLCLRKASNNSSR